MQILITGGAGLIGSHGFADISPARERLPLEEGLLELAEWLQDQAAIDRVDVASRELAARGLTV